jgi:hypothetical protein
MTVSTQRSARQPLTNDVRLVRDGHRERVSALARPRGHGQHRVIPL